MKLRKYLYHTILALLLAGQAANAQDIHFSQFFETPLLRNPALAGIFTGDFRVQTVFRDKWPTSNTADQPGPRSGEYKCPVGKASNYFPPARKTLNDKQALQLLP